ncbi:MAG TPA: hypothetical protein VF618_01170 [Thermoanaerobaculia bacterium]
MNRVQLIYLHACVALSALTGGVFAWMKYFLKSEDEFAVANHPWQPHMLSAHVVIAPLLVFALGWTFSNHIWPKFRFGNGRKRLSGVFSMLLIVPMTLSAYLLQISTGETTRYAMEVAHWITSAAFVVGYVVHLLALQWDKWE